VGGGRVAAVEVPHLKFPLRLVNGALATVEQDSLDEVRQCVFRLVRTPRGARPLAPEVGVDDPSFTAGVDPDVLASQLMDDENGEPRAQVTATATGPDGDGRQKVRLAVALAQNADEFPDPELIEP
jgi:phage baseplate assembly protein W